MNGFFSSFKPFLQKYLLESVFITIALILTITSISLYVYSSKSTKPSELIQEEHTPTTIFSTIMVEVSGAVKTPGVYGFKTGNRLQDAIKASGGLTESADTVFVTHNFNMARYLQDQEKYYVPSKEEIQNETFSAKKQILDYTTPQSVAVPQEPTLIIENVSINTSSVEDIDTLPGVGPATAQKIIQARPYSSIEELVTKKAVTKSVYEKIKTYISL